MPSTSLSLLQRLRHRSDEAAWRLFADLYTPLLFRWLRGNRVSESDAADVVQEIFALLLKKLPEFEYDPSRTFRGWLRTVAVNKLNQLRRGKKLPIDHDFSDCDDLAVPEENHFWNVEYKIQLVDRASEMIRDEFNSQTWELYHEHVRLGRGTNEVAQELGVSTNRVYAAKSRIVQRLRVLLDGALD